MSNSQAIGYELSPWGRREVSERAALGFERRGRWMCSPERLEAVSSELGLPNTAALRELEQELGGWCSADPRSMWGFGVALALDDSPDCTAIAARFRKRKAWFATDDERRAGPVDWSCLPLRGTGYPRAFFRDRALVPFGMAGEEHVYFAGERGEIYLFLTSIDQLFLVAGSGRTLIERWGMSRRKLESSHSELHICADVAALVADALGVPRFEPASDEYFTVWANDDVQIVLVHDVAPNIFGTHVATRQPDVLVRAAKTAMATRQWPTLKVWASANNIDDLGGRAAVVSAGVELDVLFGPGPGNFEYNIDPDSGEGAYTPSTYDSSEWK